MREPVASAAPPASFLHHTLQRHPRVARRLRLVACVTAKLKIGAIDHILSINSVNNGRLRLRDSIANLYPVRNRSKPMPCQDRRTNAWIPHRHNHGCKINVSKKLARTDQETDHLLACCDFVLLLCDGSWKEYYFYTPALDHALTWTEMLGAPADTSMKIGNAIPF